MSRCRIFHVGRLAAIVLAACALIVVPAFAQRRGGEGPSGVYKTRIAPHWFDGSRRFWYRNDLPGRKREYILVDAQEGTRAPAFDHAKLATALTKAGIESVDADRLEIEPIEFKLAESQLVLVAGGKTWQCNLESYELTALPDRPAAAGNNRPERLRGGGPRASSRTGSDTEITFVNRTDGAVELFWLDSDARRQSYGTLRAGERKAQHTFAGHIWEVVTSDGRSLGFYEGQTAATTVEVDGRPSLPRGDRRGAEPSRGARPGRDGRTEPAKSPDGKWIASIKDHNVVLRLAANDAAESEETPLTTDGREGLAYGQLQWSPDSQSLVAFKIEPGDEHLVHLVESSPSGGGRAVLHSRPYALPGDKFTAYEMCLFNVAEKSRVPKSVERVDFGRPRLRWDRDGHTFTYEKVDRGHQRMRLIEVDALTGASRNLIDEQTQTFIWTAHTEGLNLRPITWLEKTNEILYVSERDGWRHLYLVDAREGAIRQQITQGSYVVRGIDRIDEDQRQIWFQASGRNADQDPYFIHFYRVNFDGAGLVALTEGNGTHSVQYSPDRAYLIDSISRVDQPPVHELRRTSDGSLVCRLEEADISELVSGGWNTPEPFVAKGRDGVTDIWGVICRPRDFDPAKKYPVIEHIYAGPQSAFVPKSFGGERRFSALTELGFVVVQIDGMGTAHRSKAFHDVCWKNLKDAGFPDRILWHQAVAAKYPWYDISRVGIYGGSAGGQNSTGAVLFHPEFYKAAVSGCGCHDNRLDKASWNEQWMGYPVGPQYAECSNIDNAARLRGKLMLIVGGMDTNVPPESTYRLADALIKAGKDFDFVLVPAAGHGMGGAYGTRRMHDFFVRHLQAREPPDRNGD
jgi:dipeptidyl-peptidase-4